MKKCFELIPCPYRGKDPHLSDCPVYARQSTCWIFDWVGFYQSMANGEDKKHWLHAMVDMCRECEVYREHAEEMEEVLKSLIYCE